MLSLEDFTTLPHGFRVPQEGLVEVCPRCGRNGVEEHPSCGGRPYFLHRQAVDVRGDGMLIEPLDSCELGEN
ncbi:MAG TPA: hypothetical protein VKE50_11500 [Thermoanaerobaculia bacterium]|nr:hypothetical protein [Thermoanaerobaculia bacterium]